MNKENYKIIIALLLVFFLVVILGVFVGLKNRESPAVFPSPPLSSLSPLSSLGFLKTYPKEGEVEIGNTNNAINVFFDYPINALSVDAVVSPETKTVIKIDPYDENAIVIIPETNWLPNTNYIITIKAGALSIDGLKELKEDIQLKYFIKPVIIPTYPNTPGGI